MSHLFTALWNASLQAPHRASLRFLGRHIVYASLQPHRNVNDIAARLSFLQKSSTSSLQNTFSLGRMMIGGQMIASTAAPQSFAGWIP